MITLCFALFGCNVDSQLYLTDWTEIQSIEYTQDYNNDNTYPNTQDSYRKCYKSTFTVTFSEPEEISEEENQNRKNQISDYYDPSLSYNMPSNRHDIFSLKTKYFYYGDYDSNHVIHYYKKQCTGYEITYVKIRLCSNGAIEIKKGDEPVKLIQAISYTINYFSDYKG